MIVCFPRGLKDYQLNNGEYLCLHLVTLDKPRNVVKGIFHAFVMGRDGAPRLSEANASTHISYIPGVTKLAGWGWNRFMKRSDLEANYLVDGCITFICGITILHGNGISVPASDLGNHFRELLDSTDGSDVSFSVGGETFSAHRAVLAARSPVFKAQLFGSMAESKMDSITLHDIQPATFKILLRFIYTDALPTDKDLDSSSADELLRHLLAAADMYHLDRLKLMCAQKLWERVSAEAVATTLGCVETYNCPELKKKCIDFIVAEENFKKVVLSQGYLLLMQSFPSVIDEIRARVGI
ncbi:hypothetical protein ACP70R_016124 [Stipagrostis hirtigluma subsp. patula]